MKKIIKTGVILALAAALIVAGVFAAQTATFGTTATITFANNDAFVRVQGAIVAGDVSGDKTHDDYTYTNSSSYVPKATAGTWAMGAIELDATTYVFQFTLTFTNNGTTGVKIEVTPPTVSGLTITLDRLTGTITDVSGVDTVADLAKDTSVVYTYTVALSNYKTTNLTDAAVNFGANMTKI